MKIKTKTNNLFLIYASIENLFFFGTIWVIYMQVIGNFSLTDIAIMDTIYWLVIIIAEIPTGYFADVFGRKLSVIIGISLKSLGMFLFLFSYDFLTFTIANIVYAIGYSFQTGAEEAWIFDEGSYEVDTPQELETLYQKFFGKFLSYRFVSNTIAGLLAGFLAEINIFIPILLNSLAEFTAIFVLILIPQQKPFNRFKETKVITSDMLGLKFKKIILSFFSPILLPLIILAVFMQNLPIPAVFWIQAFFNFQKLDYGLISIILASSLIIVSFGNKYSKFVNIKLGKLTEIGLILLISIPFFITGIGAIDFTIIGYLLFSLGRGLWLPFISLQVNKELDSKIRTTQLSIISSASTFVIMIAELASALFIDHIGGKEGYLYYFIINGILLLLIYSLVIGLRMISRTKIQQHSQIKEEITV